MQRRYSTSVLFNTVLWELEQFIITVLVVGLATSDKHPDWGYQNGTNVEADLR